MKIKNTISKELLWAGSLSLCLGGLVYIVFRENVYISNFFENFLNIDPLRRTFDFLKNDFICFYFSDFLWAFSFECWLHLIVMPKKYGSYLCGALVFCIGFVYEFLQKYKIVGGTFDTIDILLYFIAAFTVSFVYSKRGEISMKKTVSFIAVILLVLSFTLFALGSGEDEKDGNQGTGSASDSQNSNDLGDYGLVIDSCRLAEDYEGKKVAIVKYKFTNNGEKSQSFYIAFDDKAYQDGIGLNEAYVLSDSANYDSGNQTKDIKPGATLDVEVAYQLNDTKTDITVEVEELFSLNDKKITKTFKIS